MRTVLYTLQIIKSQHKFNTKASEKVKKKNKKQTENHLNLSESYTR